MPSPTANARLRAELIGLLSIIPRGYVAAIGEVSRHLRAYQPHIAQLLADLGDAGEADVPWWRVVADGGAIGRHPRRAAQMARLRADGVPLSPVGIVQEFADRRVMNLAAPPTGDLPAAQAVVHADPAAPRPARSRGMKSHPGA